MKRLLIICQSLTSFGVLAHVGKEAIRNGYNVSFLYHGKKVQDFAVMEHQCLEFGATCVSSEENKTGEPLKQPMLRTHSNPRKVRKLYKDALAFALKSNKRRLKKGKKNIWKKFQGVFSYPDFEHTNIWPLQTAMALKVANAVHCIDKLQPDAIVTAADGVSGYIEFLTVARDRQIPIVTVPYGFPLQVDFDISMKQKAENGRLVTIEQPYGHLVKQYCKQWIKEGVCEGALMFVPEHIVALETLGVTLERPWTVLGNLGHKLCVEGDVNGSYYIKEGVPKEKLVMTGSPYCDIVYESSKDDVLARNVFMKAKRIRKGRTCILISWPTSYHDKYIGQSEFKSYIEMTKKVIGGINSIPDCDVTVSCHPAMNQDEREVIKNLGVELRDDFIIGLIPKHDVFISFFSSTIRWALAAGKVVVNYDMYKLNMDMYDNAPGFYTSPFLSDIEARLKELSESQGLLEETMSQQIKNAKKWGVLDGKCSQRIISEVDKLIGGQVL